ncbi:hypothetical protein Q5P01_015402 [Channa striata]|uniref:Dickkopf-related protein 1/2/4 C-terminal subdomain 1 domain-containing protein n=1 Tax=Channa striata TaxID=64152 RepID=A0AA88SGC8_CHASR|nr:hypothetical protein Q5P01_015402 [Channa striata]
MWVWRSLLCVSMVWGLALDSNTIRSSKEMQHSSEQLSGSNGDQVEPAGRHQTETNSNRQAASPCTTPECLIPPKGRCSNRAQRRPSSQERQVDRAVDREADTDSFNKTNAAEMSSCVRSNDCAAGLCCARYLTGKRCQRIPGEGEACLLRGSTKRRRNLGRCDCGEGLVCSAVSGAESGKAKGQGVCRRKTRHPGKKRRTAESSC